MWNANANVRYKIHDVNTKVSKRYSQRWKNKSDEVSEAMLCLMIHALKRWNRVYQGEIELNRGETEFNKFETGVSWKWWHFMWVKARAGARARASLMRCFS